MHGYMIWAALNSSSSFLPMIEQHLLILVRVFTFAISMTNVQYSSGFLLISSEALKNWTCTKHQANFMAHACQSESPQKSVTYSEQFFKATDP